MTVTSIHIGQSRVVWFFTLSCLFGGFGITRTLLSGLRIGVPFALGWCTFILLMGTAAWYLYVSKRAGWYLSLIVTLTWLAGLITMSWNLFTIILTVGMVTVLIWLFLPGVTAHFGVKI
jgi:hypothetical protein